MSLNQNYYALEKDRGRKMAQIVSGNVEIYIRQLLSEALGNDVDSQKQALAEKLLKDDKLREGQDKDN